MNVSSEITAIPESVTSAESAQQTIAEEFGYFSDWTERYQYLIDLGRKLPDFPDAARIDANKVHGCQSQVWPQNRTAFH